MSDTGKIVALVKALAPVADQETVDSAVETYLDNHPEATTTVQDGSITEAKLAQQLATKIGQISSLSDEIDGVKSTVSPVEQKAYLTGMAVPIQNLFKNNGYYVKGTDEYKTYNTYKTTDFIPIDEIPYDMVLTYEHAGTASASKATVFDSNYEYLGYSMDIIDKAQLLSISANVKYVRYSCFTSNLSGMQLTPKIDEDFTHVKYSAYLTGCTGPIQSLFNESIYYNKSSTLKGSSSYKTTGFIPIDSIPDDMDLVYVHSASYSASKATIFDSNYGYLGYTMDSIDKESLCAISANIKYVRFTCNVDNLSAMHLNSGLRCIAELQTDVTGIKTDLMLKHTPSAVPLFSIVGYYTKGTGTFNSGGSYNTTKLLPIDYLDDAYLSYVHPSPSSANKVTLFNENVEFIGYSIDVTDKESLLEIAPTAKYFRYTCSNNNLSGITTIEVGNKSTNLPLSANIFMRVGCIGDSYTAGYIKITEEGHTNNTFPEYSWVEQMKNLTGREWTNFGIGGSSTRSWITGENGLTRLSEVQANGNKCQAYVIGLGINDINGTGIGGRLPVGTIADIGTDANSYYAYYYKLIRAVYEVNNDAKIFLNTLPQPGMYDVDSYNEAVRNLVTYCRTTDGINIYLCDLAGNYYTDDFYANPIYMSDMIQGHYTAICYNFMAQCFHKVMSEVINSNISSFQDVFEIDYDSVN